MIKSLCEIAQWTIVAIPSEENCGTQYIFSKLYNTLNAC